MARKRPLPQFTLAVLIGLLSACGGKPAAPPSGPVTSMQSIELKAGAGEGIVPGKVAVVQYTGWLYEATATDNKGKQFDSSRTHGQPFRFPLGAGNVIKGWDQGVAGMKVGEQPPAHHSPGLGVWRRRRRRRNTAGRDVGVRHRSCRH